MNDYDFNVFSQKNTKSRKLSKKRQASIFKKNEMKKLRWKFRSEINKANALIKN